MENNYASWCILGMLVECAVSPVPVFLLRPGALKGGFTTFSENVTLRTQFLLVF